MTPSMTLSMKTFVSVLFLVLTLICLPTNSFAEIIEFGNEVETELDELDTVPPACELNSPSLVGAPFAVTWSCVDNYTPEDKIQTEIWIYKNGFETPFLAGRFMGFPASKLIDAEVLKSESLIAALPIDIRVRATDSSGNAGTSEIFTIEPIKACLLYTSPSPRDATLSRMPSSA